MKSFLKNKINFPTSDLLLASLGGSGGSGFSPHSDYRLLNLILHLLCTLRGKTQGQRNQKSIVCQSFNALDQKKCSIKTISIKILVMFDLHSFVRLILLNFEMFSFV